MGKSNIILIDGNCFFAAPKSQDEEMANNHLIEFCVSAEEKGYRVSILNNDYNPKDIHSPNPKARKAIRKTLEDAITGYLLLGRTPAVDPGELLLSTYSFTKFQILRKGFQKTDTKENGYRFPIEHELDDVAIVVSSGDEKGSAFKTLVGDYRLYVTSESIDSFESFGEVSRRLQMGIQKHEHDVRDASQDSAIFLQMTRDSITFSKTLDGNLSEEDKHFITHDPRLVRYASPFPRDIKVSKISPPTSRAEFFLANYFASLLRQQNCPAKAEDHQKEAIQMLQVICNKPGGAEAAQAIDEFVARKTGHRPAGL